MFARNQWKEATLHILLIAVILFNAFTPNTVLAQPASVLDSPHQQAPDLIFADSFESGDFSAWYWADHVGTNLTVSTQAAAVGTYGMSDLVNSINYSMVYDHSPVNQKHYSARFYFNPNSINIPNGQGFAIFALDDSSGAWLTYLFLRQVGSSYRVGLSAENDSGSWIDDDGVYINNAWTEVEVEWQAASVAGANDGYVKLWLNDTLVDTIQNLDTDTKYIKSVDLGVDTAPTGTLGTMYFDAFESRTGSHIGVDVNGPSLTALPTPPDSIFADGFEANNLSAWSWTTTDGGNLSTSTVSKAIGTYGVQALINDTHSMYLGDSTPHNEKFYDARFYFNPNSVNLPNGKSMYIFAAEDANWDACLSVQRLGADYRLGLCAEDDALNWFSSKKVYITNTWQAIEVEWKAATAAGANNGYTKLYVNDTLVDDIEGLDNDTRTVTEASVQVSSIPAGTTGTVYFDGFESHRYSHIGLDASGPALPPANTDLIFQEGFEAGDFSSWSYVNTNSGDLTVSSAAALFGTYGESVLINDTSNLYARDDSPYIEAHYSARLYLNPNSLSIPVNQGFSFLTGGDSVGTAFRIMLYNQGGAYKIHAEPQNDTGSYIAGQYITVSNATQMIEVEYQKSSAAGANDGYLKLWINDVLVDTLSNLDNDTRTVDSASIGGVNSIDTGTAGTYYIDGFESRRGTHIGPISGGGGGSTPTPTNTPTNTATATATNTPMSTPTNTATGVSTSTYTPTATSTGCLTYISQPDATAGIDMYISSGSPSSTHETSTTLGVGEDNGSTNYYRRSVLQFDLSSIPSNAVICSATLSLFVNSSSAATNDRIVRVYRLKTAWSEQTGTWNIASTGVNWQVAGASGANDRESTDIGSLLVPASAAVSSEQQWVLNSAKIQEMVNGTFANRGFLLQPDTEVDDLHYYYSSDYTTATKRPKLVIQYSVPSGTATATATGTATNTPTKTPTANNTATPTNTVTPTVTPTLGPVSLSIDSVQTYAVPGQTTTINWHVTGFNPAQRPVTLKFYAPSGFTPVGTPGTWDSANLILSVTASANDGSVDWQVASDSAGPYLTTTKLFENTQEYASTTLTLDQEYKFTTNTSGGQYATGDGLVQVNVPAGAISVPATVLVGDPTTVDMPPSPLSNRTVEVLAIDQSTGQQIRQLSQPATIQMSYSTEIPADAEGDLAIYYYNPDTGLWERLASTVDTVNNTITAQTTHFSVFDMKVEDWQASNLPTVANFQVSQFTGAATYSVDLTVPQGPYGLEPSLSVSYNSQSVDGGNSTTQAGWAGMGWSLDTGYIERDTNSTPTNYNDDIYTVVYGGVSSLLLHDGAGKWQIADENFWRVERSGETWYLWDKSGNKYTFGIDDASRGLFAACQGGKPWRYALSKVTNIYNQSLTYSYVKDGKTITGCSGQMDTALYPSTITYPNNRYRVSFSLSDRGDYDPSELSFFNKKKLTDVIMQWDVTGSGSWQTIRSYKFTYYNDAGQDVSQVIFPNYVWTGPANTPSLDKHTLTLKSIQEFGTSGGSLPAPTFQYGDGMHLTHADNGFGATVDYSYEMWYDLNAPASTETKQDIGASGQPCGTNSSSAIGNWALRTQDGTTSTSLYCKSNKLLAFKQITNTQLGTSPIKPGRLYKINVQAKAGTNTKVSPTVTGSWLDLGLFDNAQDNYQLGTLTQYYDSSYYSNHITLTGTSQSYTVFRYLPVTASKLNLLLNTNGVELDYYSIVPVPTYYRVLQKTLSDGNPNEPAYTYTYQYTGAATNNDSNSAGVATSNPYSEKYSEFRGHRSVTETGPDGKRAIITWFNQSDDLKGREERTFVTEALGGNSYKVYTESSSSYSVVDLTTGPNNLPIKNNLAVTDLGIRWIKMDSSASCSYNATGTGISYNYIGSNPNNKSCFYQDATGANTVGTSTANVYDTAANYGNLLSSTQAYWNGSTWVNFKVNQTDYTPPLVTTPVDISTATYVVELPAWQKTLGCATGGVNCTTLLGATYNYYDGSTTNDVVPTAGKLTRVRSLMNNVNGTDQYSQVDYSGFDAWGNVGTTTTYDGYITLGSTGTPVGARSTTQSFDPTGTYVLTSTNAMGSSQTTIMEYDYKLGLVTNLHEINDKPGHPVVSTATYDQFGRIQTITLPDDALVGHTSNIITYYDNDRPFRIKVSQWIQGSTYFNLSRTYDGLGRMITKTTNDASVEGAITDIKTDYTYDGYGRVLSETVPYTTEVDPFVTTNVYDVLGRITRVNAPNGDHTDTAYVNVSTAVDPLGGTGTVPGLQTSVTDPANRTLVSLSDPLGRNISVTPPLGLGVTYTYDLMNRLKTALYAGKTTSLGYDYAGRKTSMTDPAMGTWAYGYNALGNMTTQTDARLCVSTMVYDNLNRVTSVSYSGPENGSKKCSSFSSKPVQFQYDLGNDKGRLNSVTVDYGMPDATVRSFVYDVRGQIKVDSYTINNTFTFDTKYDYAADRLEDVVYPDGETVSFGYTPQKLVNSITSTLGTYVSSTNYDASNRVTTRTLGASLLTDTYTYNAWNAALGAGKLNTMTLTRNPDSTGLQNLSYGYYQYTGNINTITDYLALPAGSQVQAFTYDDLDRLKSASATGGTSTDGAYNTELYTYDPTTGDLKTKAGVTLSYDPNRAHAVLSTDTGNVYTYDENGNQITRKVVSPTDNSNYTLYYDAANHLVQVDKTPIGGGTTTTTNYIYDGQGNLVAKKTAMDETVYVGQYFERTFPLSNGQPVDDSPVPMGTILPFAAASCPTNWALVSGNNLAGTAFYNIFPRGVDLSLGQTPGLQGGNDTHHHVYTQIPSHNHGAGTLTLAPAGDHTPNGKPYGSTVGTGPYYESGNTAGSTAQTNPVTHTHTISGNVDYAGVVNPTTADTTELPPYLGMLFCKKSVVNYEGVPLGAVAIFDLTSGQQLPAGWTHFTALDGKFPRGTDVYTGVPGGSATHTHIYSAVPYHTHPASDGTNALVAASNTHTHTFKWIATSSGQTPGGKYILGSSSSNCCTTTSASISNTGTHTHTVTGQTASWGTSGTLYMDPASSMPRYLPVPYAQKTTDDGTGFPMGSIMMWLGSSCPASWSRYTALDGRFPLGSANYVGTPAGSDTHTHTYSQLPPHVHTGSALIIGAGGAHTDTINLATTISNPLGTLRGYGTGTAYAQWLGTIFGASGTHTHALTGSTGYTGVTPATTESASNIPSYTAVAFCEKTSGTQQGGGNSTLRKYYFSGTQRIAMRDNGTLYYLSDDYLDSTSIIIDASGNKVGELRYKPWGETRYTWGSTLTDYQYTGQRNDDDSSLYFYKARWYDSSLGRFAQADSIVPPGLLGYDRYAYANNDPILHNDPTGHCAEPLTAALCGLILGVAVNYTIQTIHNYQSGMSLSQAANWSNIDKKALTVAAVGGAVSGLTMGLAAGAAGIFNATSVVGQIASFTTEYVLGGAASNVAGGQAEALASAALDKNGKLIQNQSDDEFYEKAYTAGFKDKETIKGDAALGAVMGTFLGMAKNVLGADERAAKYLREPEVGPWVRPLATATDFWIEYMNQGSKYQSYGKKRIMY